MSAGRADALWTRLRDAGLVSGAMPSSASDAPWYLVGLLGGAAWIAALCFFGFFLTMFESLVDVASLACVAGAACCALAIGLLRIARGRAFFVQAGIACSLVGQLLIGNACMHWAQALLPSALERLFWLAVAAGAMVMYRLDRLPMHRFLCGSLFAIALLALFDLDDALRLPLAAVVLAWLAAALWWRSARFDRISVGLAPMAWAISIVAIVALWLSATDGRMAYVDSRASWMSWARDLALLPLLPATAACVLARMPGRGPAMQRDGMFVVVAVAAVLALLWLRVPGVAIGGAFAVAGFALYRPALLAIGLLGVAGALLNDYWQMETTLLEKAFRLVGSGVAVLALRWFAPRAMARATAVVPTQGDGR